MTEHRHPTPDVIVACEQLLYSYALRADTKDADGVVALFTEDAVLDDGTGGTHTGRDAVHAYYTGAMNPDRRSQHSMSNLHFTQGDAPGVVDVDAQLHAYVWSDDSAALVVGRYRDTLQRGSDGRWRIATKRIVYERRIDLG